MTTRRTWTIVLVTLALAGAALTARAGNTDSDGDGMPDEWEESNGLDPTDPSDATEDADSDGLINRDEYFLDGNPQVPDTDGDGLEDGSEAFRWRSDVTSPNRIIGRVSVVGRCRTGDAECPTKYLRAIRVRLLDDEGATLAKRRTHSDGRFAFGDVEPGRYEVVARDVAGTWAPPAERVRVEEDSERPERADLRMRNVNGPGVVGQATQSPTCAAQREWDDCVAALGNAPIQVKDAAGGVVARTVTGRDGFYAFELEPGEYKLVAKGIDDDGLPAPPRRRLFTVAEGESGPHVVDSPYDTGMR